MIREITITAVLNGFVVRVDCQTLVFNSREDLLKQLSNYLEDPDTVERVFTRGALNARHTMEPQLRPRCDAIPRPVDEGPVPQQQCTDEICVPGRIREMLGVSRDPGDGDMEADNAVPQAAE